MRARTLWLLSLLVTAVVVVTAALTAPAERSLPPHATVRSTPTPEPCVHRALAVLHGWDRRRARTWARGNEAALLRLYARRSRTAARDVAMLTAYRSRGLRVASMERQVLALKVRACGARRISVLVTDRLVDAVAVGHRGRTGLPAGRPVTRRVDLRRQAGAWRVSEVYAR
jgi:hypothetical protein